VGTFRYPVGIARRSGDGFEETMPLVDTGALYSQFPANLLDSLGYEANASRRFRLADGTTIERPVGPVTLRINDEVQSVLCIFGGEGSELLLGAVTLETFSLAPDPVNETLVPVVAMLA
jgi:predicted aspartyl protease